MRWHSEHGMGHVWAPKDSPAAGATRYGHGLTRRRTREKTGRRTRLWRYISGKFVELMSEISGVVVEPRWRYSIITSRLFPKVRLGWLAPHALESCLALYLRENSFCVKSTRCPRDGTPVFRLSCAVPPQKSVGLFSVRVGCLEIQVWTQNSLEWNERPRIASFHSIQLFQPARIKF